MYAMLVGAGLLSVDVHVYAMVEVAEVGEREGYVQGSIKEALEDVRVRAPYGGCANMLA